MRQKRLFFVIVEVEAHTAEKAIKGWKEGEIVGLLHRTQEVRELTQAIGFEATKKEWSDYEENVPETMGYHAQFRLKQGLGRKKYA